MSVFTTTWQIYRTKTNDLIECPDCGHLMLVEELRNKRGKWDGITATCTNGCKDEEGTVFYYAYNLSDLTAKVELFKQIKA